MAETVVLKATKREGRGGHAAEKLRRRGQVPGVVYGHKQDAVALSLSADELLNVVRHGARVVELQTDGGAGETALIWDLQWDHLGKDVLHVDFRRTARDERIVVNVPIELRGIAPGVTSGGVLDQQMHTLEIECLAVNIPETIRVNISELQQGAAIHVRELHLPEGVKAMADPDAIVVHVTAPQAVPEPTVEVVPGPAEPEIVGRRVAAEEEGEEKK
jgi:large subunit ribosomal protein L25